ncbi:hypothetical protein NEOLI_004135 [Neolecta irregularis DAH-3]|uniref:Uncharacterized protein n=1 Tax=Neolecta irregularis (strain DAH-3) TaxID=1198029 RepID=A0A1U7LKK3_NEOID|nr:hypothetical protein NEOLI_004135 [Neolecta irregularis DAH-3]|eukprot:OLL23072.1 hypothetical protein NEOLI_004135 [Neolecta irregularis DAH-3]
MLLGLLFPLFCTALRVPGHVQISNGNVDFFPRPDAVPLTLPRILRDNELIGPSSKLSDRIVQEAILACADMCENHEFFGEICLSFMFAPGNKQDKCQGFVGRIGPRIIPTDSNIGQQSWGWIFNRKLKDPPNWFPEFYSNGLEYSLAISSRIFKLRSGKNLNSLIFYLDQEHQSYANSLISSFKTKNVCYKETTLDSGSEVAVYAYLQKFNHHRYSSFSSSNPRSATCLKMEISSTVPENRRIVQAFQIASEGFDPYWIVLVIDPKFKSILIVDVSSKSQSPHTFWDNINSNLKKKDHPFGSQPKSLSFYFDHPAVSSFLDTMLHFLNIPTMLPVPERPAYALLVTQAILSSKSWEAYSSQFPHITWLKHMPSVPTMSHWKERIKWFLSPNPIDTLSNTGLARTIKQTQDE